MVSMSYCAFENTHLEMNQCVDMLENASSFDSLDHNDYEQSARQRLYSLAQQYIEQYERLLDTDEDEDEFEML